MERVSTKELPKEGYLVFGPKTKNLIVWPTLFDADYYRRTKWQVRDWKRMPDKIYKVRIEQIEVSQA